MKTLKTIIIGIFFLYAHSTLAQNFGLKSSLLLNNVHIESIPIPTVDLLGTSVSEDFTIGLVYKNRFNDFFSLKTEIGFSRKGYDFNFGSDPNKAHQQLNYVDFAAIGMFNISKKIALELGFEPSYLMQSKLDHWFQEDVSNLDVGLIGGVSYFINEKIEVVARYYYGMVPVYELSFTGSAGEDLGTYGYTNRNFEIGIGYYFF